MEPRKIRFGDLKIGPLARRKIAEALDRDWVTEGPNVREFEERYAEKFGWKHCIATSSGSTAGEVVWAAVRELTGASHGRQTILTPACAFVATANSLLSAGIWPRFVDISLDTLNLNPDSLVKEMKETRISASYYPEVRNIGVQFVATMGKPTPIGELAAIADQHDLYLIGDFCEAHGARVISDRSDPFPHDGFNLADHYCDAAIYSFYVAHLIQGGEGGCVCTDDDEMAELCRSIKSHGRPAGSNYFDFQRVGFNAKWNDLCAAIALESLEKFDEVFAKRRNVRTKLIRALEPFEDRLILYRDAPGGVIAPHAFPVVLREGADIGMRDGLYQTLETAGVECKTLFGSLPTQHRAFSFLGHSLGDFPIAEYVGNYGFHFGCHERMTDEDIGHIHDVLETYFKEESRQWQQDNCRHSYIETYGGHTYCVFCEKEFP